MRTYYFQTLDDYLDHPTVQLLLESIPLHLGADPPEVAGTYIIENVVDQDVFFTPRLLQSSSSEVYTVVDSGVSALDFFPYNGAMPGAGLDCLCVMPPSTEPYFIGYYSYDSPGYITASETSVRVFDTANDQEIAAPFVGPFALEVGSGDLLLEITD